MIGWIILALLILFVAVLMVRTAAFKPKEEPAVPVTDEKIDEAKTVSNMQALIRCRTVSYTDKSKEDNSEFDKLEKLLPTLFPHVFATCTFVKPGPRSLLFHWKGKSDAKPGVLMAHYDVVPVDQASWSKPAFDAVLEDGVLWGRGTLDTKGTFLGVLQSADTLIEQGFTPANDLYLAFAGDEEIAGTGAPTIVKWLSEHHIEPAFVLDEGGAVVQNVFPGVAQSCAVVGTGEKGQVNVRFTVSSNGGHASTPPAHSPVGILAKAVARVEDHPFPFHLSAPAAEMFDTLGRRSTFLYRMIFANLWCFKPVLNLLCKKSGGELNALVRTTVAFTQMQGSAANNVLPPEAWVGANLRLNSSENVDAAMAYLKKVIHDDRVKLEPVYASNPSRESRTDDEPFQRLSTAIRGTWTDAVVTPYLMIACSDSRHYGVLSDHVFRFSAMALSKEERGLIHANDERVPVATLVKTVAFYQRLIKMC